MKLSKLVVLGEEYAVKFTEDYVQLNGEEYAGTCDSYNKIISVSKKESSVRTLLHELVHAIIHEAALNQADISHDAKEIICEQVSRVMDKNFRLSPKR